MVGQKKIVAHASLCGANMMWGLLSPVAKIVLAGGLISPFLLTTIRSAGAMALFWILSFFLPKERLTKSDLLKLFGAAMLAIIFNQGCFIVGVSLTSPVDASIITTSAPLITLLISALVLNESITSMKLLGIAAGASGAILLVAFGHNAASGASGSNVWGDILVLIAQLSYSLYMVLFRDFIRKHGIVTLMKWMFTFASLVMIPLTASEAVSVDWPAMPVEQWAGIGYVVVFATFFSYMLQVEGMQYLRPTVTGMYNYVQPVVATIVAILWSLDEFSWLKVVSVVLIFSGVYLVTRTRER